MNKQCKVTNNKTGVGQYFNKTEMSRFFREKNKQVKCTSSYTDECFSETPIQDYMNVDRLSILDVLFILFSTFAIAITLFLLIKSII